MTIKLGIISQALADNASLRSALVKGGWGERDAPLEKMLRARVTLARTSIEIKIAAERAAARKGRTNGQEVEPLPAP